MSTNCLTVPSHSFKWRACVFMLAIKRLPPCPLPGLGLHSRPAFPPWPWRDVERVRYGGRRWRHRGLGNCAGTRTSFAPHACRCARKGAFTGYTPPPPPPRTPIFISQQIENYSILDEGTGLTISLSILPPHYSFLCAFLPLSTCRQHSSTVSCFFSRCTPNRTQ